MQRMPWLLPYVIITKHHLLLQKAEKGFKGWEDFIAKNPNRTMIKKT
jgi:hypothetical protein